MNIPVERLELFCDPSEDAAYLMKSVWLDVDNSRLLATDGHMAVRADISLTDGDVSGVVPVEVFELARKEMKAIVKAMGKDQLPDPWIRVTCHEENVQIENLLTNTQHFVLRKTPTDAKFPNVDATFPAKLGDPTITLNRDLLSVLLNALKSDSPAVNLWLSGSEKAIAIGSDSSSAFAVLMPCKSGIDPGKALKRGAPKKKSAGEK